MARILVIDDDSKIRLSIRLMLEPEGHTVTEAGDGKVGIELFKKNGADLIITDIIMPEKEGLETITELRKQYPDIKIIAISGGGRVQPEDYLGVARGFGAILTLAKPFGRKELLDAVNAVLE